MVVCVVVLWWFVGLCCGGLWGCGERRCACWIYIIDGSVRIMSFKGAAEF